MDPIYFSIGFNHVIEKQGVTDNISCIFLLWRGVQMKNEWITQYEQRVYSLDDEDGNP